MLQFSDDILAVDRQLVAFVIRECLALQGGFVTFAYKGETQEFKGFTVDIQVGSRGTQRQADALAVLGDGVDLDFFPGAGSLAFACARVADRLMSLVQHLESQAVDQLLKGRIVFVAGQDPADRELRAQAARPGELDAPTRARRASQSRRKETALCAPARRD